MNLIVANVQPGNSPFRDPVNASKEWHSSVFRWNGSEPPTNFYENTAHFIGLLNLGYNTRSDGNKGISHDWGTGSPDARIPKDFFAIRSYTHAHFEAGKKYKIRLRSDDGYQLFAKHHNTGQWVYFTPQHEWRHDAYGAHKEIDFQVSQTGWYDFHFHHYEGGGNAYFDLAWEEVSTQTGRVSSRVGSVPLRFRSEPNTNAQILDQLSVGTSFSILRQLDGGTYYPNNRQDWYEVEVNGQRGYVAAYYVDLVDSNDNQPPSNSWQHPLSGYPVTSEFGWRDESAWGGDGWHNGIDLGTFGTTPPVKAAKGGTVVIASGSDDWNDGYGNYIKIDHGNGLETRYAHLSSVNVSPGQTVSAGTHIGDVGNTGNSTGHHLHFEIRVNGVAKNPRDYIEF